MSNNLNGIRERTLTELTHNGSIGHGRTGASKSWRIRGVASCTEDEAEDFTMVNPTLFDFSNIDAFEAKYMQKQNDKANTCNNNNNDDKKGSSSTKTTSAAVNSDVLHKFIKQGIYIHYI